MAHPPGSQFHTLHFFYILPSDAGVYSCRGFIVWDGGDQWRFVKRMLLKVIGDLPTPEIFDENDEPVNMIPEVDPHRQVKLICRIINWPSIVDSNGNGPMPFRFIAILNQFN